MRRLLCLPLLAIFFAAAPAAADDMLVGGPCAAQADCPLAFSCEMVEVDCAGESQVDCACPPCEDGNCPTCGPCEDPAWDCTPTTEQRCVFVPQDCTADADCTTPGFACHLMEECSGSGCACPPCDPDGGACPPCDCDEPEEESCTVTGGYCLPPEQSCATDAECGNGWLCADVGRGGHGSEGCMTCDCAPCAAGQECPPCDCDDGCGGGDSSEGGGDPDGEPDEGGSGDPGEERGGGSDDPRGDDDGDGICLPPGWEEQLEQAVGGIGGAKDGGSGRPQVDGEELAGNADGQGLEDDVRVTPNCNAAGAGGGTSIFLAAAALALALRRR